MRILGEVKRWDGALRLAWAVCTAAAFLTLWVLQQGGSWPGRIWGALLAAFAPIVIAWPFLARVLRQPSLAACLRRGRRGSLHELAFLRRAGAI